MSHRISFNLLSLSAIEEAKKELEQYKESLNKKCQTFVELLSAKGVITARENVGQFGEYIVFTQETNPIIDGCKCVMYASDTGTITRSWQTKDGIKTADISPLLMTEFGSGFKAKNPKNVAGVGQGTFPNQTHAFDKEGWYYQSLDGVWHHSTGIEPTQPMLKAFEEMFLIVQKTASEVFG